MTRSVLRSRAITTSSPRTETTATWLKLIHGVANRLRSSLSTTQEDHLRGAGALFGLIAVRDGVYFVDDASNTFNFLH